MNEFDFAGIPTTFAILGVVFVTVLALRYFNQKFPQVADRIKNATPWMGWTEDTAYFAPATDRRPSNRW